MPNKFKGQRWELLDIKPKGLIPHEKVETAVITRETKESWRIDNHTYGVHSLGSG